MFRSFTKLTSIPRTVTLLIPSVCARTSSDPLGSGTSFTWLLAWAELQEATRWGRWSTSIAGSTSCRQTKMYLKGRFEWISTVGVGMTVVGRRKLWDWSSSLFVTALMPYTIWRRTEGDLMASSWSVAISCSCNFCFLSLGDASHKDFAARFRLRDRAKRWSRYSDTSSRIWRI